MQRIGLFVAVCALGCASEPVADPIEHCVNRAATVCLRERIANRLTDEGAETCLSNVPMSCAEEVWPDGCTPTPDEANDCIRLLRREDLLDASSEALVGTEICELCP